MAWHHKACWNEHGGCSACGKKAYDQSSQSTPAELPALEVTEKTCTEWKCENSLQQFVNAPGYDLRCEEHALAFAEKKSLHYKAFMALFGLTPFFVILIAILDRRPSSDFAESLSALLAAIVGSAVTILLMNPEASKHKKHQKTLKSMKKDKGDIKKRKSYV